MRRLMAVLALAVLPTLALNAQQQFEYAAKYTCGKATTASPDNFAPGTYFTSINVRSTATTTVTFRKSFTVSLIDEVAGGVTPAVATALPPGQSLQVQCRNIITHLVSAGIPIPAGQVTEGFVVILSPVPLDVFGIYTASNPDFVSTLHMEHIIPRTIP